MKATFDSTAPMSASFTGPESMSASFLSTDTMSAVFKEPSGPHLALEDLSGFILLEDGGELLLETAPTDETMKATFKSSTEIKGNF